MNNNFKNKKFNQNISNNSSLHRQLFQFLGYPTPTNISYLWNFGSLSAVFLFIQISTGLMLSLWYVPHVEFAFESVDFIMRNVYYGWLVRYLHSNGASFFFLTVYIHIAKSLFFGSYTYPREYVWYTGMLIFILMILTAFLGYILPWGQMSYWAATVITSLVSVVPIFGNHLLVLIWGGMGIEQPTLTRIYGLHFFLPFVILGFVFVHILILHKHGSNNPLGIKIPDYTSFHPYFTLKDIIGVVFIFFCFLFFVFFYPNYLSHPDNYIPANPNITPAHIVPEWYFLPFYGILRSVPSKFGGVILLISAIFLLIFLPKIHEPLIRSSYFRPAFKLSLFVFFASFYLLGWSGTKPIAYPYYQICQFSAIYFFSFFIIILPLISIFENKCYDYLYNKTN